MRKAGLLELKLELFLRLREKEAIKWETKSGLRIPINRMSDKHLLNTIAMLERPQMELEEEYIPDDIIGLDMNDIS